MPDVEVEGPDGNTYQFPDGTDKNAAIKYFKAKGIGAAGAATASAPPKLNVGAPSTQPMSQQYLVGGGTPEPLSNTVGRMAHDAVRTQGALSAMVPTAIHRSLQGSGLAGPRSRLFPGEHTPEQLQKEDLPNAALMTEMGAAEGMEATPTTPATPRGRTVPKPPTAESLAPEQVEAVEKANRTYQAAKAQVERRQGLERASKDMVQKTHDNLQQTYATARGALDQRWSQFRQGMEGASLDPSEAFNKIEAAKAKYLKGSPASLQVFNNLAQEMGIQEFMEGDGGALKAIPGSGELPFDTARVHYSAIGDKLAQGNLPGNVYQALKAVQEGLDTQLTKAAESRGLGKTYTSLKGDESQFRSDWVDSKSPLARAKKSLSPAFLEQHVINPAKGEYISNQLKRYTEHGAQPHLPLAARRFAQEASEIMKRVPEVKELPQPEATPKGGIKRRLARIVGGTATSTAASAVGIHHTLATYIAGSEAAGQLYDRATRPRTVPPPPDE